jgi:hypothetical protein
MLKQHKHVTVYLQEHFLETFFYIYKLVYSSQHKEPFVILSSSYVRKSQVIQTVQFTVQCTHLAWVTSCFYANMIITLLI